MRTWFSLTRSALVAAALFTTPALADSATPLDINKTPETVQSASEQEDELVTDRPDYTESSEVVRTGWMQVESGLSLERSRAEGSRTVSVGNPLMRIGVSRRLELRFGSEGIISERFSGSEAHQSVGRGDLETGFKLSLRKESHYLPAMSFIGAISLPTANSGLGSGSYDPGFKLTWSKSAPAGFSTAGNFNWSSFTEDGSRIHQRAVTLSVGHDLVHGFRGFWEVYGLSEATPGSGWTAMAAAGISHAAGKDAQWDVSIEHRMTAHGPDWVVGAGVAFRRPLGLMARLKHR